MKERIIGAIIVVAVVVLVVPVFLDGPPGHDEIRSERVPLPGQSDQKMQTVVLERDRKVPVPAQTSPASTPATARSSAPEGGVAAALEAPGGATPESRPGRSAEQPGEERRSPEQSAPSATVMASSTGMWAVQLGSFGNQDNAERLAADLRKQGFAAFLSQLVTPEGQLHRVRIGPQKNRESAEAMAARIEKAGHRGQVVPHP